MRIASLMGVAAVLIATSAATALTFSFRHDPTFFFLDTVSVAAIPEPETWMLLMAGVAITGAAMRRRRARVLQPA